MPKTTKKRLYEALNISFNLLARWSTLFTLTDIHFRALCYEGTKHKCPAEDEQYYYSHYLALGITAVETMLEILVRVSKDFNESISRNAKAYKNFLIALMIFDSGANMGYFMQIFYSFIATLIADVSLAANYITGDEVWGLITAAAIVSSIIISSPSRLLVKKLLDHLCKCVSENGKKISGIIYDVICALVNAFVKMHNTVSTVQGFADINVESWNARIWRIALSGTAGLGSALMESGALKPIEQVEWLPKSVRKWLTEGSPKEIQIPQLNKFSLTFDQGISLILTMVGAFLVLKGSPPNFLATAGVTLAEVMIGCYALLFLVRFSTPKATYTFAEGNINTEPSGEPEFEQKVSSEFEAETKPLLSTEEVEEGKKQPLARAETIQQLLNESTRETLDNGRIRIIFPNKKSAKSFQKEAFKKGIVNPGMKDVLRELYVLMPGMERSEEQYAMDLTNQELEDLTSDQTSIEDSQEIPSSTEEASAEEEVSETLGLG